MKCTKQRLEWMVSGGVCQRVNCCIHSRCRSYCPVVTRFSSVNAGNLFSSTNRNPRATPAEARHQKRNCYSYFQRPFTSLSPPHRHPSRLPIFGHFPLQHFSIQVLIKRFVVLLKAAIRWSTLLSPSSLF